MYFGLGLNGRQLNIAIKEWLNSDKERIYPPILFDNISACDFLSFIVSLTKSDGTKPSFSTYNTKRAAFKHLFRMYQKKQNENMTNELESHFCGLKRVTAIAIQNGNGDIKSGKSPISLDLYRFLALELLKSPKKE